ncbi:MAG: hypothetical protein OHK005_11780 [Candidatus Methylacidiphilales bacterium]
MCTQEGDTTHPLIWHRQLLEPTTQAAWQVELQLPDIATPALCLESRISPGAGSAWETWKALGTPPTLSPGEMRLLRAHSQPRVQLIPLSTDGKLSLHLDTAEVVHLEIRPYGQPALAKGKQRGALALRETPMSDKSN